MTSLTGGIMANAAARVLCILAVCLTLAIAATAQTVTGTIQGTVTDTSGAVLPGVTITIRGTDTGSVRVVATNEAGIYTAPYLQIGGYAVTAELTGFGNVTRDGI